MKVDVLKKLSARTLSGVLDVERGMKCRVLLVLYSFQA